MHLHGWMVVHPTTTTTMLHAWHASCMVVWHMCLCMAAPCLPPATCLPATTSHARTFSSPMCTQHYLCLPSPACLFGSVCVFCGSYGGWIPLTPTPTYCWFTHMVCYTHLHTHLPPCLLPARMPCLHALPALLPAACCYLPACCEVSADLHSWVLLLPYLCSYSMPTFFCWAITTGVHMDGSSCACLPCCILYTSYLPSFRLFCSYLLCHSAYTATCQCLPALCLLEDFYIYLPAFCMHACRSLPGLPSCLLCLYPVSSAFTDLYIYNNNNEKKRMK